MAARVVRLAGTAAAVRYWALVAGPVAVIAGRPFSEGLAAVIA